MDIGKDGYPKNHHRHKCYMCGTVWIHHNINDSGSHLDGCLAHECPKCGVCNWKGSIYVGLEEPTSKNGKSPPLEQLDY